MLTHCIVTEELAGLNKSGGIGAASRGLVDQLTRHVHHVDVLITDLNCTATNVNHEYVGRILFLADIVQNDEAIVIQNDDVSKAYAVYRFLSTQDYAVVHFNEWRGSGFYCAMARRQSLFPSYVVTHLHGSSEWVRVHNGHAPELEDLEREAIERSQIENSDLVISPSKYLLGWYKERGFAMPLSSQLNWTLPQWRYVPQERVLETRPIEAGSVSELIFFGRHERRKGLELFVDAVSRLPATLHPDLTFLGRFDRVGQEFTGSHIFRKLSRYGGRIRFFDDLNQEEALARISRSKNALCVMPSLVENSPCVVGECFTIGVPFLTTDVGGTSELIAEESRPHCTVSPNSRALAEAIERVIRQGLPSLKSALWPGRIAEGWGKILASFPARSAGIANAAGAENPLVSVCLAHHERSLLLHLALEGLFAQTYSNIEIIVVDDGSKKPEVLAYLDRLEKDSHRFPLTVIRSKNRYLGAARNLAVRHANGEFILFHDDDNIAEPCEISTFVHAALSSGCDILTSQYWVFSGNRGVNEKNKKIQFFPMGVGGVFSFFRNRFGDANALFRRTVYEKLGGFTELHGVGCEDWELFLRAFLRGVKIGIVPEPLFNYRVSAAGMLASGDAARNHERLYAMIDHEQPRMSSDLLRYAQRQWVHQQVLDKLWATLGKLPFGDIHLQLLSMPPDSKEARLKLSDLAFAIGRVADAIELGVGDFWQREKFKNLAANLSQPIQLKMFDRNFLTPEQGVGDPVVIVRGWAFAKSGEPFIIESFTLNGEPYNAVARFEQERNDVNQHFNLTSPHKVGFVIAAKKANGNILGAHKKLQNVSKEVGISENIACRIPPGVQFHVDSVMWGREIDITPPRPGEWSGILIIESEVAGYVLWRNGVEKYVAVHDSPRNHSKVLYDVNTLPAHIRIIIPKDGRSDVIFA